MGKQDDISGDINPCRELKVNNAEKIEATLFQMEQWSIVSNVVNYVKYDKYPKNFHSLNVSTMNKENYKRNMKSEEEQSKN